MTETMRRVEFSGSRTVTAPATWGQLSMWMDINEQDRHLYNQLQGVAVPPGLSLEDVLSQVVELVRRHESLRTVFQPDDQHSLLQRVISDGEIDIRVVTIPTKDPDATDAIEAQERQLLRIEFDLSICIPIRFVVLLAGDAPYAILFCSSHIAADLQSGRILVAELGALLRARLANERPPAPRAGYQPVELALAERSPAGQVALSRALDYWRGQLTTMPRTMFPVEPAGEPTPDFAGATLSSPSIASALGLLAARYQASTSAVLLAVVAIVLSRYTGMPRCAIMLMSGNRLKPGLRYAVGNIVQETPAVIDVDVESFGTLVRNTWSTAIRAYLHGRYDKVKAYRLRDEISQARGAVIDLCCYYNDTRSVQRYDAEPPDADMRMPSSGDSVFTWKQAIWREKFSLQVFDQPGSILLDLSADGRLFPPAQVRAFLFSVERLLAELIKGDCSPARLAAVALVMPSRRDGRWVFFEDCWVDLNEVRQLLCDAVEVHTAEVAIVEDVIVGYVVPCDGNLSVTDLHAACLAALPGRPGAVTPRRYVINHQAGGREATDA